MAPGTYAIVYLPLALALALALVLVLVLALALPDAEDAGDDADEDEDDEHAAAPTVMAAMSGANADRRLVLGLNTGSSMSTGYLLVALRLRNWSM